MAELGGLNLGVGIGNMGLLGAGGNGLSLRKNIYADVLSNLRLVMVGRMVKPEEVCFNSTEDALPHL